jgi:Raf kinase inhibitor-like YbhB/YbcL family protein
MQINSDSFSNYEPIPSEFAFCLPDPESHVGLAQNRNPHLSWRGAPEDTKSFALICVDPDVPSKPDDVNQEGRVVPADLPRTNFYHWVLTDIPATLTEIEAGSDSDGVTTRGKDQAPGPGGSRRGVNDYTNWFAGDADMSGKYCGYDGPCPPWNDAIRHRYVFTVYALDIDRCPVDGDFGGGDVLNAIEGHVLDQAGITGTYSLNPDVPA